MEEFRIKVRKVSYNHYIDEQGHSYRQVAVRHGQKLYYGDYNFWIRNVDFEQDEPQETEFILYETYVD